MAEEQTDQKRVLAGLERAISDACDVPFFLPQRQDGKAAIYLLIDPRDDQIRYVGKAVNPRQRFNHHRQEWRRPKAASAYRCEWARELAEAGLPPSMGILEWVASNETRQAEAFWIRELQARGYQLVNSIGGGGGCPIGKGRSKSALHRERLRQSTLAYYQEHPEARERIGQQHRGKTIGPYNREVVSAATKKRWAAYRTLPPTEIQLARVADVVRLEASLPPDVRETSLRRRKGGRKRLSPARYICLVPTCDNSRTHGGPNADPLCQWHKRLLVSA